jgi:hypothetical protein
VQILPRDGDLSRTHSEKATELNDGGLDIAATGHKQVHNSANTLFLTAADFDPKHAANAWLCRAGALAEIAFSIVGLALPWFVPRLSNNRIDWQHANGSDR